MEIKCTGNNGNGCFLDSCGHNCGCEGIDKNSEYKDLIEEEKLVIDMRRATSWRYVSFKLWRQIFK